MHHNTHEIADMIGVDESNVALVGSTLICGKGNDFDFLVLTQHADEVFHDLGFTRELDPQATNYPTQFTSWRKDKINLIVTDERGFFFAEYAAALSAMMISRNNYDFDTRDGRVEFHSAIRGFIEDKMGADL